MEIEPKDLYFSREAATYLNISMQRLNKLTNDGVIKPFKKNSSGTIYLFSELEKRKQELAIFSSSSLYEEKRMRGAFKINSPIRHEALNFAVIMLTLGCTEKKLSPIFDAVSSRLEITSPIPDNLLAWCKEFNLESSVLLSNYRFAEAEFSKLKADDEIIKIGDTEYPKLLAETEEAPRFLYLRGDYSLLHDTRTVALVGSRSASEEGIQNTRRVAKILGHNGIIVVSGLAKGIDVTAHKTALENGFKTIAVIGTNLNQYYPSENRLIQEEIEQKGLVISQFSPAAKTERWFFPLRNGVMSGISRATVIMEAGETSGALKQASFAAKQGRLVLIPRNTFLNPNISWPKSLVKKGAKVVRNPSEIIDVLTQAFIPKINDEDGFVDLFSGMDDSDIDAMYIAEDAKHYGKKS